MSLCHVAIATLQLNRERAPLSQIKTSRLLDQSLMETGEGACLQLLGLSCIIVVCALDWEKKETGNCLKYIDFVCIDRYTHTFILYLFICMYIYIHKGGCGKVLTEGQVCQERGITWVKKTWNKCSRSTWSACHGCQGSLKNPLKADHRSWPNCILRRMFQKIYIKQASCYAVSVLALQVLVHLSLQTQVWEWNMDRLVSRVGTELGTQDVLQNPHGETRGHRPKCWLEGD